MRGVFPFRFGWTCCFPSPKPNFENPALFYGKNICLIQVLPQINAKKGAKYTHNYILASLLP